MTYYRLKLHNGARLEIGGTSALLDASVEELRVLLTVIERAPVAIDAVADVARLSGASLPRARAALRYWCECGVLAEVGEAESADFTTHAPRENADCGEKAPVTAVEGAAAPAAKNAAPAAKKALRPAQELADMPAREIAKTVKNENLASFVDAAEQTVGRVFNLRELNILTGLVESTPFSQEYLLTLICYCKGKTKRFSFGYLEKTAYSMLEREIFTTEALDEYLALVERVTSEEYKLRRLFGFGDRRLSTREREYFERWVGVYGYTVEIIGIAYDIAVNNTGKLALAYMDKLITRFYENGCRDVGAVEALLEKERAEMAEKPISRHTGGAKKGRDTTFHTGLTEKGSATDGSSFVASDFLSAALRRSYGDEGEEE